MTAKLHVFYVKFDYMGIVIMISGCASSPIYYSTYCEELWLERYIFLGFVYTACAITYAVILTPKYCTD